MPLTQQAKRQPRTCLQTLSGHWHCSELRVRPPNHTWVTSSSEMDCPAARAFPMVGVNTAAVKPARSFLRSQTCSRVQAHSNLRFDHEIK